MTKSQDDLLANISTLSGGCGWGRLPGECSYARRWGQKNSEKDRQLTVPPQSLHAVLSDLEETVERIQNALKTGWRWYTQEIDLELQDRRNDILKIRRAIAGGLSDV